VSTFTQQVRGRGARSNGSGRYEAQAREAFDDGWTDLDEAPPPLRTTVTPEAARAVITRNDSPDVGFDRSINPYRGCEHGCIYCYARPSHAYMGLSPGLDFESRLFFKPDAARLLEKELSAPRYVPEFIHIGGNTDPYQPQERRLQTTRQVLEVLSRFNHPFSIITKSALIQRDLDLLRPMAARNLVRVPVIPGLNDHELEAVLDRASDAGAQGAGYVALRLPLEIKDLFAEWLASDHPDRAARVMSLVRQMRGGKDYDAQWGLRMRGQGPIADLLSQRFKAARRRYGLDRSLPPLDLSQFRVPPRPGDQIDLFATG
jgi:DNA repair photolyase